MPFNSQELKDQAMEIIEDAPSLGTGKTMIYSFFVGWQPICSAGHMLCKAIDMNTVQPTGVRLHSDDTLKLLEREYGLNAAEVCLITDTNDSAPARQRRDQVLFKLESIPVKLDQ